MGSGKTTPKALSGVNPAILADAVGVVAGQRRRRQSKHLGSTAQHYEQGRYQSEWWEGEWGIAGLKGG